jgi:hypothetical protein
MNNENHTTAAPVHPLVGQLRELLAKVPPGAWGPQHNNYGTGVLIRQPGDFINVCWWDCESTYEHTEDCRDLIIAAVNALPALLNVVEAAEIACGIHADDREADHWMGALMSALSSLPNAQESPGAKRSGAFPC